MLPVFGGTPPVGAEKCRRRRLCGCHGEGMCGGRVFEVIFWEMVMSALNS